jgi:PiT family inorganic phosphate transporter
MEPGQGSSANLVTSALVIGASALGSPVSTTHVSIGSMIGLGAVTGGARWKNITGIVLAWLGTLPLSAGLAWAAFMLIKA